VISPLPTKTFCILPWINISTDTNGDVRLCCVSSEFLQKDDGSRFNLGQDNLQDILNSRHFKQVRQDMSQGKPVQGCERCYHDESFGGKSNRIWHTMHFIKNPNIKAKVNRSMLTDNSVNTVEYFDIRFGNLCNLACRSCYPGASSQLNREVIKLRDHTNISKFHLAHVNENNAWNETAVFRENLLSQLDNIDSYYMNGGEPTIINSNLGILQTMIDQSVSENITVSLNSNMTNGKKEFYDLLPKFKVVRFMASIDGVGRMQEYLRYPSDWNQIDKNFKKLLSLGLKNLKIQVTPVVSKINLQFLTELLEYFDQVRSQYSIPMDINPIVLHQPALLDVQFLPLDYKTQCWNKIQKYIDSAHWKFGLQFLNAIEILKNKCLVEVPYIDNLRDFFEYNDILDANRGQKLSDINHELDGFRKLL